MGFGFLSNSSIKGNSIEDTWDGIFLIESSNNIIKDNLILNASEAGIGLETSNYNIISKNIVIGNCSGSLPVVGMVCYSSSNNTLSENQITSDYNICLSYSSCYNTISSNNISDSKSYGIYICFYGNSSSDYNSIYYNNFINNTMNAYDECNNTWYNTSSLAGNYWDDFESNPGYPNVYEISGGDNVDFYPLTYPH